MIPTGCSLLNASLSGNVKGGYGSGRLVNLIGDTHAGKSILALTGLAVMAHNFTEWADYLLLYWDIERALSFDIERMFGRVLLKRLEDGWKEDATLMGMKPGSMNYLPPKTIEDMYQRLLLHLETKRPFIIICDSFDSVSSKEDLEHARQFKNKGEAEGSYKTAKPRLASEMFRVITDELSTTQSLLNIISQTRENIDPISPVKVTRSGGKALEFYASHIIWLAKLKAITKGEKEKKINLGRYVQARIAKTKLTGWEGKVTIPILRQIGVDEVGASVDFCVLWSSKWKKKGATISCDELNLEGNRSSICREVERNLRTEMRQHLQEAWDEFMEASKIDRVSQFVP